MKALVSLLLSIVFIQSINAQEAEFEEVVVTGTKINFEFDAYEVPSIMLLKKADSILLEVTVINDSRKKEMRIEELHKTLKI